MPVTYSVKDEAQWNRLTANVEEQAQVLSWVYLSLDAHCRTQQHPVLSPSRDDLNSERKPARVAAAGD
jgi:hypothetical protein